jgi:hypothetical protein
VITARKGVVRPEKDTKKHWTSSFTPSADLLSLPMLGSQKVEREIVGCISGSKRETAVRINCRESAFRSSLPDV